MMQTSSQILIAFGQVNTRAYVTPHHQLVLTLPVVGRCEVVIQKIAGQVCKVYISSVYFPAVSLLEI